MEINIRGFQWRARRSADDGKGISMCHTILKKTFQSYFALFMAKRRERERENEPIKRHIFEK